MKLLIQQHHFALHWSPLEESSPLEEQQEQQKK